MNTGLPCLLRSAPRYFVCIIGILLLGVAVSAAEPLKIFVIGAHPDDPESCAGGFMALTAAAGHNVTSVYFTSGEAGIPGKEAKEAAAIRRAEAEKACQILGVRPVFFGQVDGATEVNQARLREMAAFLEREKPDLVITHWPIDTHPDHRACSSVVYHAWFWGGRKFALYYMEAMSGHQSQNFRPTDYLDIGSVLEAKHAACLAHASQGITPATYEGEILHGQMERFRGIESGCTHAEAYIRQDQSRVIDFSTLHLPARAAK